MNYSTVKGVSTGRPAEYQEMTPSHDDATARDFHMYIIA